MKAACGLLLVGTVILAGGCWEPAPGPEAVLGGDWETTLPDGTVATFTFDESGTLVTITGERSGGASAVLTVLVSTSAVDGNDVTVKLGFPSATVTYDAVLSDDQNTLDGTVTSQFDFGGTLLVTIPRGDLTLTRVGTDGGSGNDDGSATGDAASGG